MTQEVFKPIPGYEGSYEVSNLGNVRSLNRVVYRCNGKNKISLKGKVLKQGISSNGYFTVNLYSKHGTHKNYLTHILVAMTFFKSYALWV